VPAAALITDRFIASAQEMAAVQGLADYPFVVIPHPIAGNTDDELRAKAEQAFAAVVGLLTARAR
jgi:hypothetical protein